jgi:P-type E1-E2 ATPase
MENKLKPQTETVIRQLKEAQLRVIMATGDNVLTGIAVAKECGMI